MIVDFHTHIFPPGVKSRRRELAGLDPLFHQLYTSPKAAIATAPELIEAMGRDGVALSVALNIGWSTPQLCQETNNYILEAARQHPGRIVVFCSIQPLSGEEAVREVERCARAGAKGIGELRPDVQGFDLTDAKVMAPIVAALQRHRMLLLLHASEPVGHSYPGKGEITPGVLYRFIQLFPELTVVCAHWGGGLPFYALMPEVALALKNTYFDTAASPFLYRPEVFRYVSQMVGEEKVLFGSDFPLMPASRPLQQVRSLRLPQETEEAILGGNARRLLGKRA